MSGKCNRTSILDISSGGNIITSQADIANELVAQFTCASNSDTILLSNLLNTKLEPHR
jgi:hypothetical protein